VAVGIVHQRYARCFSWESKELGGRIAGETRGVFQRMDGARDVMMGSVFFCMRTMIDRSYPARHTEDACSVGTERLALRPVESEGIHIAHVGILSSCGLVYFYI
jgi:hypothetical protein